MNINRFGKAIAVATSLVVGLSLASSAMALTASDIAMLQAAGIISAAQAASLSASISGSQVSTSGYTFSTDLTVGSKGAAVTALQQVLVNGGYLVMPSGVSMGYFGALTKASVIKYQLAKGISPAAGYVGPKTRASLNGGVTSSGGTVYATGTDLKVSLAATSPFGGALVAGQAAADLAEFTFTNTSATPAVVTNVTLMRGGVSSDLSLSNVYLFQGAVRLTDSASVSSGKVTFNAASGLFTVPAGSSITVSVKADVSSTNAAAGQIVTISLTGVTSNVPVSAVYPVTGGSMTVASASDIATVALGTVSNPVASNSTINIQAGTLNQTIWQSALNISQRAVWLKTAAFKVIGSLPSDSLQNIKLFVSGVQVASAMGVDSNGMITFDLTAAPYRIDSSRTLEVRADIIKGSSRQFSVSLQNAADLQIVDSNYNVGIAASGIPASTGNIAVSNGTVTVTQDTSLSAANVVTGASNVALARYTLKAYGEDMKISYLNASSTNQLDNVALYANGVQVGSTQQITATGTLKLYSLGSSLIVAAGQTVTLEVRGDIKYNGTNATTTSNVITVGIVGYTNNTQGNFSQQLSTIPSSEIDGPAMTVVGGGLTVGKNSGFQDSTNVPNTSNQKLGSYTLQANSSEPIRITSLVVTLGGAAGTSTNVSNLKVVAAGVPSTPVNPSSSGSNNFSTDFTIAANSSATVDVYGDLGATTGVASTTLTVTGYGTGSNVQVAQGPVTGQVVTLGSGVLSTIKTQTGSGFSPDAQFVVGGSSAPIVTYNFVSTNGGSSINEMYFSTIGGIDSITVGGVTVPVVSGHATTTGLNLSVPTGFAGTNLPVSVKYTVVGLNGTSSVQSTSLTLTGVKYTSGNQTTSTTTSQSSNTMVLVGSKPSITVSGTTVGGGNKTLAFITVSADAAGQVNLQNLPLSITTSGSSGQVTGTTTVYVNGNLVTGVTGGIAAVGTGSTGTGTLTFSGDGYPIAPGSSVTFEIRATITGSFNNGDMVQTGLGASNLFVWQDVNGNATTTGASVYNYPVTTGVNTF